MHAAFDRLGPVLVMAATMFPGLSGQGLPAPAQGQPQVPLQQQIDELRAGQARLEAQLAELKALLQERSGRMDSAVIPKPQARLPVNVHGEPFQGNPKARVAVMEYSDFECSYCAKYAAQIHPQIDQAYVKTGKVKYFFRDLPSPGHQGSLFKARVARCAGDQGRFWEMAEQLFATQKTWTDADLFRLAKELGLEGGAFSDCINSERHSDSIRRSAASAGRLGIQGTPAFVLGTLSEDGSILTVREVLMGAESFEPFRKVLDELLQAAPAAPARP